MHVESTLNLESKDLDLTLFILFYFILFYFILLYLINVYLFLRERETELEQGRGTGRGRHRIWSSPQALSCQHRARRGAWTHELWDHDLSLSQTLNQLSHPRTSGLYVFCFDTVRHTQHQWSSPAKKERKKKERKKKIEPESDQVSHYQFYRKYRQTC